LKEGKISTGMRGITTPASTTTIMANTKIKNGFLKLSRIIIHKIAGIATGI